MHLGPQNIWGHVFWYRSIIKKATGLCEFHICQLEIWRTIHLGQSIVGISHFLSILSSYHLSSPTFRMKRSNSLKAFSSLRNSLCQEVKNTILTWNCSENIINITHRGIWLKQWNYHTYSCEQCHRIFIDHSWSDFS